MLLAESDVHEPVNIGNPSEMSLLAMARMVIELTDSRSEIVFEALPIPTSRQVRQPGIARARDLLGWEPEIDANPARVCGAPSSTTRTPSEISPSARWSGEAMRWTIAVALLLGAACATFLLEPWHGPVVLWLSENHGIHAGDLPALPLVAFALAVGRAHVRGTPPRDQSGGRGIGSAPLPWPY